MAVDLRRFLANPTFYHYIRQIATGGLPFRQWVRLYGLDSPTERVADLGCGPADILRYLDGSHRPEFYLGIDISQPYLEAARHRAGAAGIPARFLKLDLDRLPSDPSVQQSLVELLEAEQIKRVLLLGVLHHIPDDSAATTLELIHRVPCVESLITQDVIASHWRF